MLQLRMMAMALVMRAHSKTDLDLYMDVVKKYRKEKEHKCPKCRARLSYNGVYERMLIFYQKGVRKEAIIKVPRLYCNHCKRSDALLADGLIAYGSYSLFFVLETLLRYKSRTISVARFCDSVGIAVSTLYEWKNLFEKQYRRWLGLVLHMIPKSRMRICRAILNLKEILPVPETRMGKAYSEGGTYGKKEKSITGINGNMDGDGT